MAKNCVGSEPGSDDEKRETSRDKFCSYPWFCENATRTFRAMGTLWMRIPEGHKLRFLTISSSLPHPKPWTVVALLDHLAGDERPRKIIINPSPEFEKQAQAFVKSTVAHECASAILGTWR